MLPWNNWFHCIGSTYGTWVRGDPRGWRARHHREHVEGDYKNPPPAGTYDALHARSKKLMKRKEILLDAAQRLVACREMGQALLYHDIELIDLSVGAAHFHLIARFTPLHTSENPVINIPALRGKIENVDLYEMLKRVARHYVGLAKRHSAKALSKSGLAAPGGIWGVRGLIKPVRDRQHQLNVVRYIRSHAKEAAAVWSIIRNQ